MSRRRNEGRGAETICRGNVVHYVTRQYMKKNKKRTVVTLAGITLMVLLMTCVFAGKETAIFYLQEVASQKDGKWHVSMYGVTGKDLEQVQGLDYVEETAVSADWGTTLFPASANPEKPYLTVKGYTEKCFDWMNIELVQGRLPRIPGEIVISQSVLEDGGEVGEGDVVEADFFIRSITGTGEEGSATTFPFYGLKVKAGETAEVPQSFPYYEENDSFRENREYTGLQREYVVTGIIRAPSFEEPSGASYMGITLLEEGELGELPSFNLSMTLDLDKASDLYSQELRQIAGDREIDFNDYVLAFTGNSTDTTVNMLVQFLMAFFTVLIMAVSVVLIYNVFQISFRERSIYLGMLSSVGATGKQKRGSVYYEALVLLVPALLVGIPLGMGTVMLAMLVMKPALGQLFSLQFYTGQVPVSLRFSWENLAWVAGLCAFTVLISTFLPARKIGRTGPLESVRGNAGGRGIRHGMRLGGIPGIWAEDLLARRMLGGQKKKTRAIVLAAASFLAVAMVTSFGAGAVNRMVSVRIGESGDFEPNLERWNYSVTCTDQEEIQEYNAFRERLEESGDALDMTEWRIGSFAGEIPAEEMSREYWQETEKIYEKYYRRDLTREEFQALMPESRPVSILAVDDGTMEEMARIAGADAAQLTGSDTPSALVVQSGELSTENTMVWEMEPEGFYYAQLERMTDKEIGEQLHVEFYSPEEGETEMPVTVAGFVTGSQLEEYVTFRGQFLWIIVGEETGRQMAERNGSSAAARLNDTTLFRWDGENTRILEEITQACEENQNVFIGPLDYAKSMAGAIITIIQVLGAGFVALSSLICLLNLFHTIQGRMEERRGDLAVLRSVGMTGKQIRRMLLLENLRLLVRSLALACLISIPILALIWKGLTQTFGRIALYIPWGMGALAAAAAVLAVVLLTEYSFSKTGEENLLDNIRRSR